MRPTLSGRNKRLLLGALVTALAISLHSAPAGAYGKRDKASYANQNLVAFVRPGLKITINSAEIAADGTISTTFTITDPLNAPLDRLGVASPGAVSLSFVAARIPRGRTQYVAYTVRQQTGAVSGTVQQAAADTGGTYTTLADGRYRYVFGTKATGFDSSATHTVGIYGSRNLTEFELGTNYASTTFSFVPAGGMPTVVRDVIRTQSCNKSATTSFRRMAARGAVWRCAYFATLHRPPTRTPGIALTW
jgi:hypothetical protein